MHPGAAPLAVDEAGLAQDLEVVADRRAGKRKVRGEVADADLVLRSDHRGQSQPHGVAKGLEHRCDPGRSRLVHRRGCELAARVVGKDREFSGHPPILTYFETGEKTLFR